MHNLILIFVKLALYHIGVVKALNEQGLLPRIISGTAIGAMIAALICIHTDEELPVQYRVSVVFNLRQANLDFVAVYLAT